ncbi:MAG: hypothetical protein M0Z82_02850 [Actinomycetota bacterium]|nr:hypothetical protein [Actinomycetota bacterium]
MSTFAQRLAVDTGAERVEIDRISWQPGMEPLSVGRLGGAAGSHLRG